MADIISGSSRFNGDKNAPARKVIQMNNVSEAATHETEDDEIVKHRIKKHRRHMVIIAAIGVIVIAIAVVHAMRTHACNLGGLIASELAATLPDCPAFIADPGVVDELEDIARITGSPLMPKITIWHALNQKAIARRFAKEQGTQYEDLDLIICHLGGGISVAVHHHGRAIDANNALDGEGPFSPERAGTLPAGQLIDLCFSGQHTKDELKKRISGRAGLTAHLGTTDVPAIIQSIEEGDKKAELILDAMIYNVAKAIGASATVLCGKVDAILLTGGIAYSDYVVSRLKKRISFLAPIYVYPGENEMESLAFNAIGALKGELPIQVYK